MSGESCRAGEVQSLTIMPLQRDLRLAAGQLLIMGFEGTAMSLELKQLLRDIQPGGVILFARNIENAQQTYALLRECRRLVRTPMFLCVDMEGGTVDRLKKAVAPAPSAAAVFSTGRKRLFRQHGELIGRECRALGFNTDFAPAVDLALPASESVLGPRAVSADPKNVLAYAGEFLRGLKRAGVFGCGKHFPGLGDANLDSHYRLPNIYRSWKKLWSNDLHPYRALRDRLDFVMVTHAAYPTISAEGGPASLSHYWITQVLRKAIGYRGLIVTDDLEMGAIVAGGSVAEAARESVRAGADMFLVCHEAQNVLAAFECVVREGERDRRFRERVESSSRCVLAVKGRKRALMRLPARPSTAKIIRLRSELEKFSESVGA